VRYGEGLFIGYRGYDKAATDVAFPFGFGLSYTTFALSDLGVAISGSVDEGTLAAEITLTVTNTGAVAGAEVVQVYVRDVDASVTRPIRELKGFTKVTLDPGQSDQVTLTLDQRAFSFWSVVHHRWVVEAGEFSIEVGHHSRDLPLSHTVTISAPSVAAPLAVDSTLNEWMADPVGLELIAEAVATGQPDPTRDKELVAVIGEMPMTTLAAFKGMSIDHDTLDKLAERLRDRTQRS
jgi:beta-glucosidase